MPFKKFTDGLYLAKQKSRIKPNLIDHYGIIDIGNILNHPQGNKKIPIVIHQAFPTVRIDRLRNTGKWNILGKVKDSKLSNAKLRIQTAIKNPKYNFFCNNCEQFARYVTTGIKESKQLQAAVCIVALGALLSLIWDVDRNA